MLERARCPSPLFEFSLHFAAEWIGAHHNLLLEGAEASTVAVLRLVAPDLPAPVMWKRPGAPFSFSAADVGTLILQDVDGLSPEEQTQLLKQTEARPHAKIVSTTAHPLFALVERGRFDIALYYRLNVILLHLDSALIRPYQTKAGEAGLMAATVLNPTLPPSQACPRCRSSVTRLIPYVSEQATVDYYCCDPCGHLWTQLKCAPEPTETRAFDG
jgi:Sigma-54 interaction domain